RHGSGISVVRFRVDLNDDVRGDGSPGSDIPDFQFAVTDQLEQSWCVLIDTNFQHCTHLKDRRRLRVKEGTENGYGGHVKGVHGPHEELLLSADFCPVWFERTGGDEAYDEPLARTRLPRLNPHVSERRIGCTPLKFDEKRLEPIGVL